MGSHVPAEIHFVQDGAAPVLVGGGNGVLSCPCGNGLVGAFDPGQFLGIGIQCARCHAVTTTPPLPEGKMPPPNAVVAELSLEPRAGPVVVPARTAVIGRSEMDRLGTLLRPAALPDSACQVSPALLQEAALAFERHVGGKLPPIAAESSDPFAGLRDHALAWSVRRLRARVQNTSWACLEDAPTANAVTHVCGFLRFIGTWSRHPLFPAMVATVAGTGVSLHGLAPFAAAHAMAMMGNRVGFQAPAGYPPRIDSFDLATGATGTVPVHVEVFDRFEHPFGRPWDQASLGAAVAEAVAAVQGRINLRNPGVLVLSPGTALPHYDDALVEAVQAATHALGRKNRGLMAVAPIVLRLQATPDPHAVRFGYGLFPVANRYYSGTGQLT